MLAMIKLLLVREKLSEAFQDTTFLSKRTYKIFICIITSLFQKQ
uniref:Uncharacterized protein n=1 Tax=Arundo donax TaxID=35708 RepID=A0A0A9GWL9_ARUDO